MRGGVKGGKVGELRRGELLKMRERDWRGRRKMREGEV